MQIDWQLIKRAANILLRQHASVGFAGAAAPETGESPYIMISYRHDYGWVTIMPDFRGAMGRADEMRLAMLRALEATQVVCSAMIELGKPLPVPLDLTFLQNDRDWTRVHGVDWSRAAVHTVSKQELITAVEKIMLLKGLSDRREPKGRLTSTPS
jgi:hypothetical protein